MAPEPAAASSVPAWVLLDTAARIGRRANATTARALTSAGHPIEVSFELADPPGLSRCLVHCPDLTPDSDEIPFPCVITGADGAFLLINVILPERHGGGCLAWTFADVFVYRAGPGAPSLDLLPLPYPVGLLDTHVGVLSSSDDHCLVVVPERQLEAGNRMGYDLHVFSTETQSWSTKAATVAGQLAWYHDAFHAKVFAVGGGSLAWVDLGHGILLCDELAGDRPRMRLIQLPPLMPTNKLEFGSCFDGFSMPPLDPIRDVTCRDGSFRFVEMEWPPEPDAGTNNNLDRFRWTATISKATISSGNWERCGTVDSHNLSPADSCLPGLFPEIWNCGERKLTLDKMLSANPTLDMYHDGVVYVSSKLKADDPDGWVLAIDTKNEKLENLAPFSSQMLCFERNYMQCAFSKYFGRQFSS